MSAIEIRAEFLRIARMFQVGETGSTHPSVRLITAARYTLVEPNPNGKGAYIISTDGVVLCVQLDKKAKVDRPYTINIDDECAVKLRGETIEDRWVKIDDFDLIVTDNKGKAIHTVDKDGVLRKADIHEWTGRMWPPAGASGISTYPNWRKFLPTHAEIEMMRPGFPGSINCRYLSIIGRMYDDMLDCREVQFLCDGKEGEPVIVQFPWRPDMMLVLMPMKSDLMFLPRANAKQLVSEDDHGL